MKPQIILSILSMFLFLSMKNDKPAYRIFSAKQKTVSYEKVVEAVKEADIVFFGELHDNPISHWLQYELSNDLYQIHGQDLILAAEMFETDDQIVLDEYLSGTITENRFNAESKQWNNYKTDYKPLVELARENGLLFVASNVPRRYATLVSNDGFEALDSLSDLAKSFLPPLPIEYDPELKCYKDMLNMGHSGSGMANVNFPKAQALKDATMAHFILENWSDGKVVMHYNGAYHSDNYQGIVWYVKQKNPDLNIVTLTTVLQEDVNELDEENQGKADFTIAVPGSMTRTY
jgi:uncharacterized iron-regulated protein